MMDALSALRLHLEWGADESIGDSTLNRLLPVAPVAPEGGAPPRSLPPPPAAAAVGPQSPRPVAARTFEALLAEMAAFEGCALRTTAMQLVRPDGNPGADLVVIGEAPGSDDDRSGRAFSGASGALLDRVLGTAGIDRSSALLTTLVPWRPPGNRRLAESEVQACLPFLHRLLGIVRPRQLLLLGATAVKALTGDDTPVRRLRGRWLDVQVQSEQLAIAALALPAPEQWLSNASAKEQLWTDLIMLRRHVTTA